MEWEYLFFGLVIGIYLGGGGILFLMYRAAKSQSVTLKAWTDGK